MTSFGDATGANPRSDRELEILVEVSENIFFDEMKQQQ